MRAYTRRSREHGPSVRDSTSGHLDCFTKRRSVRLLLQRTPDLQRAWLSALHRRLAGIELEWRVVPCQKPLANFGTPVLDTGPGKIGERTGRSNRNRSDWVWSKLSLSNKCYRSPDDSLLQVRNGIDGYIQKPGVAEWQVRNLVASLYTLRTGDSGQRAQISDIGYKIPQPNTERRAHNRSWKCTRPTLWISAIEFCRQRSQINQAGARSESRSRECSTTLGGAREHHQWASMHRLQRKLRPPSSDI
jgi:hypothetical protein